MTLDQTIQRCLRPKSSPELRLSRKDSMARSKVFSTLLVVFVLVGIPSSPSSSPVASTEFYFPHVVFGDDAETTLIISNSSAQDTEVQFTAYEIGRASCRERL